MVRDSPALPVRITPLMFDPVMEIRSKSREIRRQFDDGIVFYRQLRDPFFRAQTFTSLPSQAVHSQDRSPRTGEPLHQHAALISPAVVIFRGGHIREDRQE